jgi:signal transduction histidine kinase
MRVGRKLAVLFVGMCVVPLLLLTFFSYLNSDRAVRQMLHEETTRDAHLVTEGVYHAVRTMAQETTNMALVCFSSGRYTWYRQALESGPSYFRPEPLGMLLGPVAPIQLQTPISQVILVDATHGPLCRLHDAVFRPDLWYVLMRRVQTDGFATTDTVGVARALKLRPGETALVRLGGSGGLARLRAATPAYLSAGIAPAGVLIVDVELARLLDRVAAQVLPVPTDALERTPSAFAIDLETSAFLMHADPARLNQTANLAAPTLWKDLRAKGVGREPPGPPPPGAPGSAGRPVDLAHLSLSENTPTWFGLYRGADRSAMTAYSAVLLPELDLLIGATAPRDPFVQPFWRAAAFTLAATVAVLVVSAILLSLFSRSFRHSVGALTRGSEGLARGEFSHRVAVSSSDELGELAGAFNRMASDLERMTLEREEAARFETISRVVSLVLHDLKGLVFNLSLLTENMARRGADLRFQAEAVVTLERLTGRMKRLVARLPILAAGGSDEVKRSHVDLRALVTDALDDMRLDRREGLEVVKEFPEHPVPVSLDPEGMRRAIDNLLTNALEAMPQGGHLHIRLEGPRAIPGQVVLRINDTGGGIPASFLAGGIFRPFQTTKTKGLGLGLYSAREVVRAHGGEIEVESEVGHGTTFTIRLPADAAAKAEA